MDMKRNYFEDICLRDSGTQGFWLVALPFLGGRYFIYTVNLVAIHVIVALGLNLLVGYTGQVSLSRAGLFAIRAYGTLTLVMKACLPFELALPLSGLISAGFGFLLDLPALRLESPYLDIATLDFDLTATQILERLEFLGGHMGLTAPDLTVLDQALTTERLWPLPSAPFTLASAAGSWSTC